MKSMVRSLHTFYLLLLALCVATSAGAQVLDSANGTLPGVDVEHNKRLRIQLDRTTIRAFEPIYLAVTAEHFIVPDARPEVSVWQGDGPPQPITIDDKAWVSGDTVSGGDVQMHRVGVLLQLKSPALSASAVRTYLFPAEGEYLMRVKVGPDAATMKIHVIKTEAREKDAWDRLGQEQLDAIIYNGLDDRPKQTTVDTCSRIIRTFPGTVCAGYCQAYLSIAKFKVAFEKSGKSGGKAAYESIAKELVRIHEAFGDTFLGEQTGFYAAYAKGLIKDFNGMLVLADGVKSHVTPFSDALLAMKIEVLQHTIPKVIPVDPTTLPSPATRPAK
jgi:hypothetical protein